MSADPLRTVRSAVSWPPAARVLTAGIVAGLALGPADLWAQTVVPYPWANLANSGAVWALAGFGLGVWVRRGRGASAIGAAVMLVVAVESYYLADVLFRDANTSSLWNGASQLWLAFAVVVGLGVGAAGSFLHSSKSPIRSAAAAVPGLIFLAEAGYVLERADGAQISSADFQTALIEVIFAVVVPLIVLVGSIRSRHQPGVRESPGTVRRSLR
ncbi:MAG: hypothetical protein JWM76_2053 [Pseudonocardiales bacterium]|nr:hypothetical protein [Pseudonocardiales bacterium]